MIKANTVEEYIAQQSAEHQTVIEKMRNLMKEHAPAAKEKIAYRMLTYMIGKEVVAHFHTAKMHLGFYPTPSGIDDFIQRNMEVHNL